MSENKNLSADTSTSAAIPNLSLHHSSKRARRVVEKCCAANSSLGSFDILNVKNRVVTPPHPLPLRNHRDPRKVPEYRSIEKQFGQEFEKKAIEIAVERGLSPKTVRAKLKVRCACGHWAVLELKPRD
jgi:hypothetical protein